MKGTRRTATIKAFTEAARKAPGTFNSGLVQGITEFTFWGYLHHEKLQITQVPYRDINVAPVDLGEGRIQVVMSSYAIVQPQINAGRIKLLIVNSKTARRRRRTCRPRASRAIRRSRWTAWSACSD